MDQLRNTLLIVSNHIIPLKLKKGPFHKEFLNSQMKKVESLC